MNIQDSVDSGTQINQEPRRIYTIGQLVRVHGHDGHILAEYLPGMWGVRLKRGDVCVPWQEIDVIAGSFHGLA